MCVSNLYTYLYIKNICLYVCLYNQLHIVDIKQFSFCLLNITTGVYITKPKKKKKIKIAFSL